MTWRRLLFAAMTAIGATLCWAGAAAALNPNHDCVFCHSLHASPGQALLTDTTVELVCRSCHDPATGTSSLKAEVHNNNPDSSNPKAPFSMTCRDCHTPHSSYGNWQGGTNLKLVGAIKEAGTGFAQIDTPNSGLRYVTFESLGSDAGGPSLHSFADNDEDNNNVWDGVCEACHTVTSYHRNGSSGNHGHNTGLQCTACHIHESGFWPSGGGCTDCHNTPQDKAGNEPPGPVGGRRAIVPEFSRSSHHVIGVAVADADCQACHLQDQHQQGQVRLKDPDDPTNPVPLVVLAGDPVTDPVEGAKLTVFCRACHDSDGYNGGVAPFGDSQLPPDVDSTWATASHNTVGTLSCFGDGTTGCHGSGHGSEKRKILALADVAPDPTTLVEEEEGFCFTCHDSDGPSSIDAASAFNTPILFMDDQNQYNNANLNDRHDVQWAAQNVSGAKIECTDCHDPHAANASNRLRSDPDPSDGRVPGTNWFEGLAGAGLGVDFQTEWCLDCHDGSYGPNVVAPETGGGNALVDILNTSWLVNTHGAGGGSATLKSGYGWAAGDVMPCLGCHQAHPTDTPQPITTTVFNNLFQMRDVIMSKDGLTAIPADDAQGQDYEITTLQVRRDDTVNSYYLCNTCHTGSMGSGKKNCFDCHTHSDNRF